MPPSRMLTELPSGLPGRALALGLTAFVLLFVIIGVLIPLARYWRDLDAEHTALLSKTAEYEGLIARKNKIGAQVAGLQGEFEQALDYLPQAEPAIAAAQVQVDLGELVERSGAVVRSTLTLPTKTGDGFTAVASQLSVTGSMLALRDILYGIESGQPRLVIDRLTIAPSQDSDSHARSGDVDMSVDVHGYMIGEIAP